MSLVWRQYSNLSHSFDGLSQFCDLPTRRRSATTRRSRTPDPPPPAYPLRDVAAAHTTPPPHHLTLLPHGSVKPHWKDAKKGDSIGSNTLLLHHLKQTSVHRFMFLLFLNYIVFFDLVNLWILETIDQHFFNSFDRSSTIFILTEKPTFQFILSC
jgi:hypothetical protein